MKVVKRLPSVSIVVPTFNDSATVGKALETLLRQTYPNISEIIIVDDGSTDNTPTILRSYADRYPQIKIIEIKHGERSHARNIGLHLTTGDVSFFAESDAIYEPTYLERAILQFGSSQVGGVFLLGHIINPRTLVSKCISIEDEVLRYKQALRMNVPESAWVYRTKLIKELGGFDERLSVAEDKDLAKRVKESGYRIAIVTGVNWGHPAPEGIVKLTKRGFRHGCERIPYCFKYPKSIPFIRVFFLSAIALVGFLSAYNIYYLSLVVFAFASIYITKLISLLAQGWEIIKAVEGKWYLLAIPIVSMMRHLAFTSGFLIGLLSYPFRKCKIDH